MWASATGAYLSYGYQLGTPCLLLPSVELDIVGHWISLLCLFISLRAKWCCMPYLEFLFLVLWGWGETKNHLIVGNVSILSSIDKSLFFSFPICGFCWQVCCWTVPKVFKSALEILENCCE